MDWWSNLGLAIFVLFTDLQLFIVIITRRLEFDAGHRIPDHRSLCKHLHGHRYALEVTVSGDVTRLDGDPRNGMILDFSEVKTVMRELVVDRWDHAFLVHAGDTLIVDFLRSLPDHRTVVLDTVPTAENLAQKAFDLLAPKIGTLCNKALRLQNVRLYETPNCWADVHAASSDGHKYNEDISERHPPKDGPLR